MAEVSPDPIPNDLSAAFRSAVWLYSDWMPSLPEPQVMLRSETHDMSAVCGLVDRFRDRLPDDVFDRLMIYMRDMRYTLLRQKIVADQSYTAAARCFLKLIEDLKRQSRLSWDYASQLSHELTKCFAILQSSPSRFLASSRSIAFKKTLKRGLLLAGFGVKIILDISFN